MAQIRETRCLTEKQINTVLDHWWTVLGLTSHKKLYDGKPVFSAENEKKWNLPHLTKFADHYMLWECKGDSDITFYFIILEATRFDKVNIQACIWFSHYFEDTVYQTQTVRPEVFICPAYVITDAMLIHVPVNILPCMYRFVPLPVIYPMLGGRNSIFSMTYDYILIDPSDVDNPKKYSLILDSDVAVKILNAIPGDIIQCKRVLFEVSPYGEFYRRIVTSTVTDVSEMAKSGICQGAIALKAIGFGTKMDDDDDEPVNGVDDTDNTDASSASSTSIKGSAKGSAKGTVKRQTKVRIITPK